MTKDNEILQQVCHLPAQERAAALAYWIYVKTSHNDDDWSMRVSDSWENIEPNARQFNLMSIETWLRSPDVLKEWNKALEECREERFPK